MNATKKKNTNVKISLKKVRLSFPRLFTPESFEEGGKKTYGATFILDKKRDRAQIEMVRAAIEKMSRENFGKELPDERLCLRDGADKADVDGYGPGVMFVSTSSAKPLWVGKIEDGELVPVGENDPDAPYAGCYVNATFNIWPQNHPKYGKRVNGQTRAVVKVSDGEAFGAAPISNPDEEFADLGSPAADEDEEEDEAPVVKKKKKSNHSLL